jgi:hypothetical protein
MDELGWSKSKWWSKMVSMVMEMDKVKIRCSNLDKVMEMDNDLSRRLI